MEKSNEGMHVKNFPELMDGKKILYIHGFGSSGATHTAQLLRDYMPGCEVVSPDVPLNPADAVVMLRELAGKESPDIVIGTSMGGMYAEMLHGFYRILVNPAFKIGDTMREHGLTGMQVFHNPRKDGVQEFMVTKALVKEYKNITDGNFAAVDDEERKKVFGLFGDEDDVVHTFDLFREHYPNAISYHGGHRLFDKAVLHYLIPVIRWIDDKQQGRERKKVVVSIETLMDSFLNPLSSMHKAYEMLIEKYDVYFIVPALTSDLQQGVEAQQWIGKYINAPAWNRVILSNNPEMLYADYIITSKKCPDFLGTVIDFGSDDFKTWESVISFFDRLGGQ